SGSGRLIDSIIEIYGPEIAGNMLEVGQGQKAWEDSPASPLVTGMVGTPSVNRASRTYLSFFVNRRWISSRLLSWAVEEAYHGLLMTGKHPVAVINIALPPEEVDVNVHPTKTEIRFRDERFIFSAVQKKIRQALIELSPSPRIEEVATAYQTHTSSRQLFRTPDASPRTPVSNLPLTAATTPAFSLPALRLLGQLAGSYIVAEGPDGLYLIDQHAAHERVLFEKIRQQMSQQKIEVQGLLEPETLEVTPGQDATLKSGYLSLVESGFTLEPFGERTYLVRRIPALLHRKDWAGMLSELLDTPADNHDWTEKIAMTMACHSAVRAGQTLSDDEMRALLRQLEQAALPNTCPHGRPTMIHLDSGQLEREFGRS
ncbi:MAG: DNA mismatch repair protein MutL, partial [Dehalococcoidales bacterium]|nr:DNA mismatch repair protein MutL [Dehalococcoidales bacterium]